jgi:hypothetical protein
MIIAIAIAIATNDHTYRVTETTFLDSTAEEAYKK